METALGERIKKVKLQTGQERQWPATHNEAPLTQSCICMLSFFVGLSLSDSFHIVSIEISNIVVEVTFSMQDFNL